MIAMSILTTKIKYVLYQTRYTGLPWFKYVSVSSFSLTAGEVEAPNIYWNLSNIHIYYIDVCEILRFPTQRVHDVTIPTLTL